MSLDCTEQLFFAERFGEVLIGADNAPLRLVEQAVFEDSMITGVDLKELLFLINAQV